jgi:ligand-binding SRPBCC domain-containing protein
MPQLTVVTIIQAPLDRCFDLARDVDAHCETSSFTRERTVEPGRTSGLLVEGDLVTFEASHFGVRWTLTARISEMDAPRRFVDEQVRGPFRALRHVHTFEVDGTGTRMTDVIDFRSPFGPLGWLADQLLVGPHLKRFAVRKQTGLKVLIEGGHLRAQTKESTVQEPWNFQRLVEHYNRLADERGGWHYDGSTPEAELQTRYSKSPRTYPTMEAFAEGLFIWEQRVNI